MSIDIAPVTSWDKQGVVVPEESEEKIQYGFRIILDAYRGRASTSDNEIRSLRQTVEELKLAHSNMTKKLQAAEREIMDQQHRNQIITKDNENLTQANRVLSQRCEKYKRLQQTFSEALENSGHEDDSSTAFAPSSFAEYRAPSYPTSASLTNSGSGLLLSGGNSLSGTTTVLPAAAPPKEPSPVKPKTSTGGGAIDSNGKDGKAFFRLVRTRLNYESFNVFLAAIKRLNQHEITREQATEDAKKIFGPENQDLLVDFQALITRHHSAANNAG